jgi:hypothetical protein
MKTYRILLVEVPAEHGEDWTNVHFPDDCTLTDIIEFQLERPPSGAFDAFEMLQTSQAQEEG